MKKKFNGFFNKKTENNPGYFGRRQKSADKISTAPPYHLKKALQSRCSIGADIAVMLICRQVFFAAAAYLNPPNAGFTSVKPDQYTYTALSKATSIQQILKRSNKIKCFLQ